MAEARDEAGDMSCPVLDLHVWDVLVRERRSDGFRGLLAPGRARRDDGLQVEADAFKGVGIEDGERGVLESRSKVRLAQALRFRGVPPPDLDGDVRQCRSPHGAVFKHGATVAEVSAHDLAFRRGIGVLCGEGVETHGVELVVSATLRSLHRSAVGGDQQPGALGQTDTC